MDARRLASSVFPEQDGPTTFRYSLLPHKQYDPAATQRFGIECSQPLVTAPARGPAPSGRSLLKLSTPEVILASIKPSNDGEAWIVRLFGPSRKDNRVALQWGAEQPKATWISSVAEERGEPVTGPIDVPGFGIVTLRAELP